jgi:hypothetical protein
MSAEQNIISKKRKKKDKKEKKNKKIKKTEQVLENVFDTNNTVKF